MNFCWEILTAKILISNMYYIIFVFFYFGRRQKSVIIRFYLSVRNIFALKARLHHYFDLSQD